MNLSALYDHKCQLYHHLQHQQHLIFEHVNRIDDLQAGVIFPLCPNKPENFHVKWVKHGDFNGTIFENISNGESPQAGTKFALCPNIVKKNLLMLETWKLAWEMWCAIRPHNFYFTTLNQKLSVIGVIHAP